MHIHAFIGFNIEEAPLLLDHQALCMRGNQTVATMNLETSEVFFFKGKQDAFFDTIMLNTTNCRTLAENERLLNI